MVNPEDIKKKKQKLVEINAALKKEFFGIDDVIDKVISSIESWYIIPQALKSPIIINLWGLTGVGKTQLVRSLVKKLEFSTKFVEVQMDGYSTSSSFGSNSICSTLQSSNINECEPGILLLDEFQRYRTVDESGKTMDVKRYQDVWMLLSDGKFSTDYSLYTEIERQIHNIDYWKEREDEDEAMLADSDCPPPIESPRSRRSRKTRAREEEVQKASKVMTFSVSYYDAQNYKKLLRLTEPIGEIMKWQTAKLEMLCREALEKRENDEIDYSKLLIFVCGNLDEAFEIANDLENCDTDADIFYKFSRKISIIDIKSALKERFKPEQISRLGNNHVIYPSLNKDAYQKIIAVTVQKYIDFVNTLDIELNLDNGVYTEIYNNSVYPTQGARPVFSSIHKIFSSAIPTIALWAVENKVSKVNMQIDSKVNLIIATALDSDATVIKIPVDLDIRDRKKRNTVDFNTMVSVHEACHAVVYAILSGRPPMEVNINLASFKGGYIMKEDNFGSKKDFEDSICVALAGTMGERHFFGEMNRSSGCSSDNETATAYAAEYYRNLMFGDTVSHIMAEARSDRSVTNLETSNQQIETLMCACKKKTCDLIEKNQNFVMEIVTVLMSNSTITAEEFIKLADKYNLKLTNTDADVATNYSKLLENFKKFGAPTNVA